MDIPGIVVAALRGGSGKTVFSIGIISALRNLGQSIAPFKKGPDYIDAGWLALAAGRPCYNLDTFLIEPDQILSSFHTHSLNNDMAIIEGNRGLYDCINTEGKTSTAELSKLLGLPVILCIDGTKTTRTMAAVVSGVVKFDPEVTIKGIILNQVAGDRHANILQKSIEEYTGVPVIGAVPKLGGQGFPERHMGLVPTFEHGWAKESIQTISEIAKKYIDLGAVINIAKDALRQKLKKNHQPEEKIIDQSSLEKTKRKPKKSLTRIGILRDSSFQFYYPENIDALKDAGAEIIYTSPLQERSVPEVDALYIGGGFPETHARELSENDKYREEIKSLAEENFPIYAECGGLMYLGESLVLDQESYPMAGVLPLSFGFYKRPQGHGYTIVRVKEENPYFEKDLEIRGHEFHYSKVLEFNGSEKQFVFSMKRGTGIQNKMDGLCHKNVLATYTHIHALGSPFWAKALVQNAIAYKKNRA